MFTILVYCLLSGYMLVGILFGGYIFGYSTTVEYNECDTYRVGYIVKTISYISITILSILFGAFWPITLAVLTGHLVAKEL